MRFDQVATVPVPVDRVWAFVTDLPAVSRCVPGVEAISPAAGGEAPGYEGVLRVRVGQVAVLLDGRVEISITDPASWRCVIDVKAAERRLNSKVLAQTTISLVPDTAAETTIRINTEAAILGKLGEFGQPILRRKADQLLAVFANNLVREVATAEAAPPSFDRPAAGDSGLWSRFRAWLRALWARMVPVR